MFPELIPKTPSVATREEENIVTREGNTKGAWTGDSAFGVRAARKTCNVKAREYWLGNSL